MEKLLLEAGDLIEGLRYVDDLELANDDVVGCAANVGDLYKVINIEVG